MMGVKMSFTRLCTTVVKAAPMMMPTARSTTVVVLIAMVTGSCGGGRKVAENIRHGDGNSTWATDASRPYFRHRRMRAVHASGGTDARLPATP